MLKIWEGEIKAQMNREPPSQHTHKYYSENSLWLKVHSLFPALHHDASLEWEKCCLQTRSEKNSRMWGLEEAAAAEGQRDTSSPGQVFKAAWLSKILLGKIPVTGSDLVEFPGLSQKFTAGCVLWSQMAKFCLQVRKERVGLETRTCWQGQKTSGVWKTHLVPRSQGLCGCIMGPV